MTAIFKREIKAYFTSPLGYIFLAMFYFIGGLFFSQLLNQNSSAIESVFSSMIIIVIIVIPILTMRLLSEEKKQKTDQLLMTSPVNISGIVIGKYLAAFVMYLIALFSTVLYILVIGSFVKPNWNMFLGNFLGLALLGAALISIGLFISALTENQMVAAILSFGIMMFIFLFDLVKTSIPTDMKFLNKLIDYLSITNRYNDFTSGILNVSHIIFFISFAIVFNFLTIRMLERKRWS